MQSESDKKEIDLEDDKALEFQLIIHDFYESLSLEEREAKDYKITSVTKVRLVLSNLEFSSIFSSADKWGKAWRSYWNMLLKCVVTYLVLHKQQYNK